MLVLLTAVTPFQSEIRFQMGAELRTDNFSHCTYNLLPVAGTGVNFKLNLKRSESHIFAQLKNRLVLRKF